MAKIPFDIKYRPQLESGEYRVETQVGCPVRIVCWDMACELPILGLVLLNDEEVKEMAVGFTNEGTNLLREPLYDKLFIVTPEEEKLTPFEIEVKSWMGVAEDIVIDDSWVKTCAKTLLSLAREQFIKDGYVIEKKIFHDAVKRVDPGIMEEVSENVDMTEYEKGRADTLKDLPRWKKANGKERFNERLIVLAGDNDLWCTNYAEEGEYYISFSDLEKLPKED